MAVEHVKTWEGAGWILSFRDNGHNDDDNAPTHTRRAHRLDISFKSRPARRYATRTLVVTTIPTTESAGVKRTLRRRSVRCR